MHSVRAGRSAASSSRNLPDAEKPDGIAHAGSHSRVSCVRAHAPLWQLLVVDGSL